MKTAKDWIESLQLKAHPEGGFYKEIFRSDESVSLSSLPSGYTGDRAFATSIYFLLRSEDISAFHRIKSDELWFFHAGSPVAIHILEEKGLRKITLGMVIDGSLQAIIPSNTWFSAEVLQPDSYCLVSCVVAPGFDFEDFELAEREKMTKEFPGFEDIITKFTH